MRYALTSEGMRLAEERAMRENGPSVAELMERAGGAVAERAASLAPNGDMVVLAGKGNNGGDGWVAARLLTLAGRRVTVVTPAGRADRGPAASAASAAMDAGVDVSQTDALPGLLASASLVIDALLGFGLSGPLRQEHARAVSMLPDDGPPVLAVDVPSGVSADDGRVDGAAVRADVTLALSAPKVGLLLHPGAGFVGELEVADIGIDRRYLGSSGDLEVWDEGDLRSALPIPEAGAHKGTRGRVLIVAGSGDYPGAAVLAGMGAQRSGAGYVTLAVPGSAADIVDSLLPSAVVARMPEGPSRTLASKAVDDLLQLAGEHDAVVMGPGLTVAHGAVLAARTIVARYEGPLVVDADGLNALVDAVALLGSRSQDTVLTPHPGELARLLGVSIKEVQRDRLSYGARLASERVTCLLKGARSLATGGGRRAVDMAGTVALAHAGTGDVLSGVIGTLMAQGLGHFEASVLGAHLGGTAGRLAAADGSELAVLAEEVAACLPRALGRLAGH